MKLKAVAFDIDGTLANTDHRQHLSENKDWKGFFDQMINDKLHEHVANVLKMYHKSGYLVLLVTGRPEEYRPHTMNWLSKFGLMNLIYEMFMRKSKDYRGDDIVKREIYRELILPQYEVEVVYDDRQKVVDMWRSEGLPCFQVAPGDF